MADVHGPANAKPLIFLVGASAGIGAALARRLAGRGDRVVVAARRSEPIQALADEAGALAGEIMPFVLDVTDADAFARAVDDIERDHGPITRLILNAGAYEPVTIDNIDPQAFRHIIEVNYMGVVNGLAAILPRMLSRRAGEVLVTASLSAYRGLPKAAAYGSSKAGVLNMLEALKPEADRRGVRLRVINPGFVRTRLTDKNDFHMPQLLTPEQAADAIMREIDGDGFEIVFPKRFGYALKLLRLLPYRLYFAVTRRMVEG